MIEYITITRCGDAEEELNYHPDMLTAIKYLICYWEHLSLDDKRRYYTDGYFFAMEINNLVIEDYINGELSVYDMMNSADCYDTFNLKKSINGEDIFFEEGF